MLPKLCYKFHFISFYNYFFIYIMNNNFHKFKLYRYNLYRPILQHICQHLRKNIIFKQRAPLSIAVSIE